MSDLCEGCLKEEWQKMTDDGVCLCPECYDEVPITNKEKS
jgi:hypothetical protein